MSGASLPSEVWLRGPVPAVAADLQPVAHALLQTLEDVEAAVQPLTPTQLWHRPGGAASVGYHLLHIAGSTDRLFTYARGESLSEAQRARLAAERSPEPPPDAAALVARWRITVDAALAQLRSTPAASLNEARTVGRARLPSTVLGLLFHAAEHASRHTGQIVTTAKIVGGMGA